MSIWIARLRALALIAVLSTPVLPVVHAQEVAESDDPPDRVARLSYRKGDVSLEEAGSSERSAAVLNRPLTTGDMLWAGEDSRAELQVGSATLHLDEYTGIELKDLGSDDLRVALNEGALSVHVRDVGRPETIEIDTPNAIVSLQEPGEYAIEVNQAGDTTVVKVRDGASAVDSGERGARLYRVDAGRQGIFTGKERLSAAIDGVDRRTDFEQWADDREERASRSASTRYVSREVIGYEDLDDHGDWRNEPEYGYIWYPRGVMVGWAPYRYGQWAYVRPWGWTWVDDSPWGFAPFHYGRWAYVHSRWGWVPGPRAIRPIYAPALVAWVGGPSVGVSVSFGSGIGWFPLGPREVYVPGYRASRRHINNVNISNTVIVNNTTITNVYERGGRDVRYMHQGRRDAVTAVSRDDFVNGRPVDRHQIRWDGRGGGNIEANTLSPERGAGSNDRVLPRGGRQDVGRDGRPDSARTTFDRGNVTPAQEDRRSLRSDRESAARRDADVRNPSYRERSEAGAGPETAVKESGRLRNTRPALSTDKRDRVRPEAAPGGNDPGVRLGTAPDTGRAERGSQVERRVEREPVQQEQPRARGNIAREERGREVERARSAEPQRAEPVPQQPRQERQPRGGDNGNNQGGREAQGQKGDPRGRRGDD